jgi:hypothetical protein
MKTALYFCTFLFLLVLPIISNSGDIPKRPNLSEEVPELETVSVPFTHGERLTYEVHFLGMNAGKAVLSILDKTVFHGRTIYPILSTVESNDFISMIYPVHDQLESDLDMEGLYSHRLNVKQHEGKRKREKRIEFDHKARKAVQIKNGERTVSDITPKVNDFLSALYVFRARRLQVGLPVFIDVHEGGKNWKLEIRVLKKEVVKTPSGSFNTLKVQAVASYEGIFLSKGDLFIWVTDDDRKIPVLLQSKIKGGTITLALTSL